MLRARTEQAKDKRKMALLISALDEFYERGFNAARMEDIAKRAHLSKGTLYLYFDSKPALFKALIEEIALPTLGNTGQIAEKAPSAVQALTSLMNYMPQVIRHSPMPKLMKVLIADSKAFPELTLLYRKQMIERALSMIKGVLQRGNANGEWQVEDVHLTARLVIAPMIFSVIWRVTFENIALEDDSALPELDLEGLFALHTQYLLAALGAGKGDKNEPH
jgi:AcrR family transcriptional regulator